jgi:hypothetical protein
VPGGVLTSWIGRRTWGISPESLTHFAPVVFRYSKKRVKEACN